MVHNENSTMTELVRRKLQDPKSVLQDHVFIQDQRDTYIAELSLAVGAVDIPRHCRVLALVAAFQRRDSDLAKLLLLGELRGLYGFPEVRSVCLLLDAKRRMRVLQARIAEVNARKSKQSEPSNGQKKRWTANLARWTRELATRSNEVIAAGTRDVLTATLCNRNAALIREWIETLPSETLDKFIVEFDVSPWRVIADLVHVNSTKLACKRFLPYAFSPNGAPAPENAAVALALKGKKHTSATLESALDDIVAARLSYPFLRRVFSASLWTEKAKVAVAAYTDTTTLVWWLEELRCGPVERMLLQRLERGDFPSFGYGKMMERLMATIELKSPIVQGLIPAAERKMNEYALPLRTPMVVLGDCSASMDVAVRTSSIIVSLLAKFGNAGLYFFNNGCIQSPFLPQTIKEVLVCADAVEAVGATAPAAALEPLYLRKERVATIVLVTDEEENSEAPVTNLLFKDLMIKYRAEVAPDVSVVMVSFRPTTASSPGKMTQELRDAEFRVVECWLSGDRPDLTKLDGLLGSLAAEAPLRGLASDVLRLHVRLAPGDARGWQRFATRMKYEGLPGVLDELSVVARLAFQSDDNVAVRARTLLVNQLRRVGQHIPGNNRGEQFLRELQEIGCTAELAELATRWSSAVSREDPELMLVGEAEALRCGTLGTLPREVISHLLRFLNLADLSCCAPTNRLLRRLSFEARFDAKLVAVPGEYDKELRQLKTMGLLDIFSRDDALKALKRARKNVDHAVALLFGEGGPLA